MLVIIFFFNDTATTEIYTLSLHDALPISSGVHMWKGTAATLKPNPTTSRLIASIKIGSPAGRLAIPSRMRSEEHTSELQSPCNLVCRLLLEKKKHMTT